MKVVGEHTLDKFQSKRFADIVESQETSMFRVGKEAKILEQQIGIFSTGCQMVSSVHL